MLFLLALLERLAPLLPQSWRAFAATQAHRYITHRIQRASPRDAAFLTRLCDALIDAAETEEEVWAAIAFDERTQNTLIQLDKSAAFSPRQPRRMTRLRGNESAIASEPAPTAHNPRALELSG